jgi:hypothetical protein
VHHPQAEARLEQWRERVEVRVIARRARHEHQWGTVAAADAGDARAVMGVHRLDPHAAILAVRLGRVKANAVSDPARDLTAVLMRATPLRDTVSTAHRGCWMEASRRRVLVVANRTAATPDLLDAVKRHALEQPTTFALLIPDASKSEHTDWTLDLALPLIQRAAGGPVEGLTGTAGEPLDAIRHVLAEQRYDRVVISTLPRRVSKWLRRDLPRRVEALGVPVEVITPPGRSERDPDAGPPGVVGFSGG